MATATKKSRANHEAAPVSMEFVIDEDNGGDFHWTLQDRHGKSLGRSPSFESYKHAEDAARVVGAGAGSARLDARDEDGSSGDNPN